VSRPTAFCQFQSANALFVATVSDGVDAFPQWHSRTPSSRDPALQPDDLSGCRGEANKQSSLGVTSDIDSFLAVQRTRSLIAGCDLLIWNPGDSHQTSCQGAA
jgi:hypothetical protein